MHWYHVARRLLFVYYISGVLMSPPPSVHQYNPDFHVYCDTAAVEEGRFSAHTATGAGSDSLPGPAIPMPGVAHGMQIVECRHVLPAGSTHQRLARTMRLLL